MNRTDHIARLCGFHIWSCALLLLLLLVLGACEEEFIPETSSEDLEVVVEGAIEAGEGTPPAYVILTKSLPFFSEIGVEELNQIFLHDAEIVIHDGEKEVELDELCLSEIPDEIKEIILEQFDLNERLDFCVYIDIQDQLTRAPGLSYSLFIAVDGDTLTAETTIPEHVPLDSLMFAAPPGEPNEELAQLLVTLNDPGEAENFYRYFVRINDGVFEATIQSIFDDVFFDGKEFEFQLIRPEEGGDVDPETFGLYTVGDVVTIRWTTLDKDHFNFWNSLEFARSNQGPFAGFTRIESNINGGLGVFGGYSVSQYTLPVEY